MNQKVINLKFIFEFPVIMCLLKIIVDMFQTLYFTFVKFFIGTDNEKREWRHKKIKMMKDVDDDELVFSSSRVVLKINGRVGGIL